MKKVTKIDPNTAETAENPRLKVAAYCRVSTDSSEQIESLDTQIKHYESYIKANPDWEFAGIYFDEGITGTKKEKRAGLLQMVSDGEAEIQSYCNEINQPVCKEYNGLFGTCQKTA